MNDNNEAIIIKKYANRRLYNTGTSTYVTLDDLADMVKNEEDFVVLDTRTGEDLTRSVLTQIIFEQEAKGQGLLPTSFLRQLIRFYDDNMKQLVPGFLEMSLHSFVKEQEKLRDQLSHSLGSEALATIENQLRKNVEMTQRAMQFFLPFGSRPDEEVTAEDSGDLADLADSTDDDQEISDLKRQAEEILQKIDRISKSKP